MQPLAGAILPDGARSLWGAPQRPWLVRLAGWPVAWDPLLPGHFAVERVGPERHGVGVLTRLALEAWIDRLTRLEHPAAPLLRATLNHHDTPPAPLRLPPADHVLTWERPRIMGVVNVTPDSFSDGGRHAGVAAAVAHGLALAAAGADILDVGGESTRPGAEPVALEEELRRVIPVVEGLARGTRTPISVDTAKAPVMAAALAAGAAMINDVTALSGDPQALPLLARHTCPVVLMHMQGAPRTMQEAPRYHHVESAVYGHLAERLAACAAGGIARERLLVDPGIGFGKSAAHNLALLRALPAFRGLGAALLLGVSRKRLVGALTGVEEPARRDPGSQTLAALGTLHGAAHLVRVHEVAGTRQALAVAQGLAGRIYSGGEEARPEGRGNSREPL